MIKKKRCLLICVLALWIFAGAGATALAAQSPQIPIAGKTIPKFIDPLPLLSVAGGTMTTVDGNLSLTVRMCEFSANVLPTGFIPPGGWPSTFTGTAGSGTFTVGNGIFVGPDWANATKKAILTAVGGMETAPVLTYTLIPPSLDFASGDNVLEADPVGGATTLGVFCIADNGVQLRTSVFGYIVGTTCPDPGTPLETYIGPVIVNERNHLAGGAGSTDITFVNDLGSAATTRVLAFRYATDQTMHWADPLGINSGTPENNYCNKNIAPDELPTLLECRDNYLGPIPAVPHLHGGEVPPELDGGPDAWWTESVSNYKGHAYHTFTGASAGQAIYRYPNTQEASPIWFHDHVLGITRLNVFAGLAGAYLIHDPALTTSFPLGLHFAGLLNGPAATGGVEFTVPLVIQDRMFDTNGQLFYQSDSAGGVLWATNPEHPYWTPEFLGDVIVVNGKAWPNLNVEPKRYRFWLINGSNARTYELKLPDPSGVNMNLYVIATDGGYLDAPAMTNKLVIMPGERYEVIIDFQGLAGTTLIMKNSAKSPYPAGAPVVGATTGSVMQFTVGNCTSGNCGINDNSYNPAALTAIRTGTNAIVRLANPVTGILNVAPNKTRLLTLNEVMGVNPNGIMDPYTNQLYPGGPVEVLVNNTKYGGESSRTYSDFIPITTLSNNDKTYYSELPKEGDTEVWEIVNLTADAHPIHLHLVQFQIIKRQNFDIAAYTVAYNTAFPSGQFTPGFGPPLPVNPTIPVPAGKVDNRGGKWGGNPDVGGTFLKNKKLVPFLTGKAAPPLPQEAGWKDTVVAYPGQVTSLAVRWAPTDLAIVTGTPDASLLYPFDPSGTGGTGDYAHGYVWHCHIIDHEDNEMMRPLAVSLNPAAQPPGDRPLVKGAAY